MRQVLADCSASISELTKQVESRRSDLSEAVEVNI